MQLQERLPSALAAFFFSESLQCVCACVCVCVFGSYIVASSGRGSMDVWSVGSSSLARDFGVGTVIGGLLGALGAVATKFPVLPPTLRCGAVGGCLASSYLPITVPCTPMRAPAVSDGPRTVRICASPAGQAPVAC